MNELYNFSSNLVSQLKKIDGTSTKYNNILGEHQVKAGFYFVADVSTYPFICVAYVRELASTPTDQVSSEVSIEADILGYVKDESNAMSEALKLFSDIKNAVFSNETLTNTIYNLRFNGESTEHNGFGVVSVKISGTLVYTKP